MLPVLGVCWLAFLLFPDYLGQGSTTNYAAMTLGVGMMVAGAFRFLYASNDEMDSNELNGETDPGSRSDSDEL